MEKITGSSPRFLAQFCSCFFEKSRWDFVRQWPVLNTKIGWHLFHLGFICIYQVNIFISIYQVYIFNLSGEITFYPPELVASLTGTAQPVCIVWLPPEPSRPTCYRYLLPCWYLPQCHKHLPYSSPYIYLSTYLYKYS